MTDADLRNLATDIAAAVARGDDPLSLMRIAYFSGRTAGSAISYDAGRAAGVRDAAALLRTHLRCRYVDRVQGVCDCADLAAAVLALAPPLQTRPEPPP